MSEIVFSKFVVWLLSLMFLYHVLGMCSVTITIQVSEDIKKNKSVLVFSKSFWSKISKQLLIMTMILNKYDNSNYD